jgi:hypothetical protein
MHPRLLRRGDHQSPVTRYGVVPQLLRADARRRGHPLSEGHRSEAPILAGWEVSHLLHARLLRLILWLKGFLSAFSASADSG